MSYTGKRIMKTTLILALGLLLTACGNSTTSVPQETPEKKAVSSQNGQKQTKENEKSVNNRALPARTTFNGTLVVPPQNRASVTLCMDATVKSTVLLPGARVNRGDLVATVENPAFIDLQQTFLESHAQEEFLHEEYLRQHILSKEEIASRKKLQQSKAAWLSMKSRKDAAAAQLSLLGIDTGQLLKAGIAPVLPVHAPIGGYVSGTDINPGRHVAAGAPLCEIIDKNRIMLRLTVYEKDLEGITEGDRIEFQVNGTGEKMFYANVTSIGKQVDKAARSVEVYAAIERPDERFMPGMYVTAQVTRGAKQPE